MVKIVVKIGFVLLLWSVTTDTYASNLPNSLLQKQITLLSGKQTRLADYKGDKPVYIKFWASWCKPCMEEMPHFEEIQQQYGERIQVIGINIGINDDLTSINTVIRKYNLTMPNSLDKSGELAKAFNFIGTPYHLLFDKNMNLIYLGHEATKSLDNKIALISNKQTVDSVDSSQLFNKEKALEIALNDGRLHALYFTATWCDWYLSDTRPRISKRCVKNQEIVSDLARQFPNIVWQGVLSRLWTSEADSQAYEKQYRIDYPLDIDKKNSVFHQFSVSDLPELILVQDGKDIFRSHDLSIQEDYNMLTNILSKGK